MSIDCCKSYVGKQIIGLLPTGKGKPPVSCIYVYQYTFYDFINFSQYYLNGGKIFDNQQGDGPLRDILIALDGNVVVPSTYSSTTLFFYYRGTSANNFTITDNSGNPFFTTDFKPLSDRGNDCSEICLTYTIPKTEGINDWLFIGFILFNDPPYGIVDYSYGVDALNYLNPGMPPYYNNSLEMQPIVSLVFGPSAVYSYYDDATNIYIRFAQVCDFSAVQLLFYEASSSNYTLGDMTPCP